MPTTTTARYQVTITIPRDQKQHADDLSREAQQCITARLGPGGLRDIQAPVEANGEDSYVRSIGGTSRLVIPVRISGDLAAVDQIDARLIGNIETKIKNFSFTSSHYLQDVKITDGASVKQRLVMAVGASVRGSTKGSPSSSRRNSGAGDSGIDSDASSDSPKNTLQRGSQAVKFHHSI